MIFNCSGITRRADLVDPDLRRAARFEAEIEVNVPSQALRSQVDIVCQ